MCTEPEAVNPTGSARTGRVTFSKALATIYCDVRKFKVLKASGCKANYYEVDIGG
jgi:hypothetical protein